MKLYFDNNLLIIESNEKNKYIIYSSYSHRIIGINKYGKSILERILINGSGNEFEINQLAKDISISEFEDFIKKLEINKIVFKAKEKFIENSYSSKLKNVKKNVDIKTVYLHITQKCNFECSYCYNKHNLNSWKELNSDLWFKIIDNLKSIGVKNIIFTGGEPLLYKDLLEVVKYTKLKEFNVELLTNGSLLKDDKLEILKYTDGVIVSLDSMIEEINEINRINSKEYNIINNLKSIPEQLKDKIKIRSVITNENKMYIKNMKKFVEDTLKMKFITTLFLPNNKDEVDYIPVLKDEDYGWYDNSCEYKYNAIVNCGGCYKEMAINCNGDIYPCQSLIKEEFYLANILESNWIDKIRNSKITRKFQNISVEDKKGCNICRYKFLCGGGCLAITHNVYKDLFACPDFLCNIQKKAIYEYLKGLTFKKNKVNTI